MACDKRTQGKVRRDEETFIYIDGVKVNLDEVWDRVVEGWTDQFQIRNNSALSAWEGGWAPGLKDKYLADIDAQQNSSEGLVAARD